MPDTELEKAFVEATMVLERLLTREDFVLALTRTGHADKLASGATKRAAIFNTLKGLSSLGEGVVRGIVSEIIDFAVDDQGEDRLADEDLLDTVTNVRAMFTPIETTEPPVDFPLGSIILGEKIGSGGFGVVYRANLTHVNFDFALKLFSPIYYNDDESARKRFFQEANILFGMTHPSIVRIFSVGEYREKPYILMELLRGDNLYKTSLRDGMCADEVLACMRSAADGLAHAHANGAIHRDIKPSNLILTEDSSLKILDFGVAILEKGERLTKTGAEVQGDQFACIRRLDNPRCADIRCDVYSLGAVWYWWVCGSAPPRDQPLDFSDAKIEIPDSHKEIIRRCTASFEHRYETMQDIVAEIDKLRSHYRHSAETLDMNDHEKLTLGAIYELSLDGQNAPIYALENRLKPSVSRLRLKAYLSRLCKAGWIETHEDQDERGEPYCAAKVTPMGDDWVDANLDEVDELLKACVPNVSSSYDTSF